MRASRLLFPTERTVAIQDNRSILISMCYTLDFNYIRDVQRHRCTSFGRYIDGTWNVTRCEFHHRPSVEHRSTAILEDMAQLVGRDFGGRLILAQCRRLDADRLRRCKLRQHQHSRRYQMPIPSFRSDPRSIVSISMGL